MPNYDGGHQAKRIKTETDGPRNEQPAFYNYNANQRGPRGDEEARANHILLMTVINPTYPISVDVIHTIASPLGKVVRIVIFKKNGVQAMVEFENVEAARRAKQSLNGADIYSGCCTLKIEYAKPDRLNVHRNDSDSWDYTNPNLDKAPREGQRPGPLLRDPPPRFSQGSGNSAGGPPFPFREGGPPPRRGGGRGGPPDSYGTRDDYEGYGAGPHRDYPGDHYEDDGYGGPLPHESSDRPKQRSERWEDSGLLSKPRFAGRDGYRNGGSGPRGPPQEAPYAGSRGGPRESMSDRSEGGVVMVYGLNPEKMNCDALFNLLCLYGNIMKVKFLKTKEGCAMVEMGDFASVERAVYNLNNLEFFGSKMQLGFSKQTYLNDVMNPFDLPDGTPSFKFYFKSRNNRFMNADAASKNRISQPCQKLHFFNTPFGILEDELKNAFVESDVAPPTSVKLFASKSERSSSGIMEFESVSDAVEAIVICNHKPISHSNAKSPFMMKLCFSAAQPGRS